MKKEAILLSVFILGFIPVTFATSDRSEKLEFTGTLEETLGHFWALEQNLDEKNTQLALVHATHPISELYGTMSAHLQDNPEFNEKLKQTLLDLPHKANTDVSRSQAQLAIDEAKEIIQEARKIVVGLELSEDSDFKMQLINGLLETSKVEYAEAISDGIIEEMAEFQDGSAFVWRSQQIYHTFEDQLDPIDSARLNVYYADVWNGFENRDSTEHVENLIDSVIYEFEDLSGIASVSSEHEEEILIGLSPLKQLHAGVESQNISCKSSMELVFKSSGVPACVKISSIPKLINWGWTQ